MGAYGVMGMLECLRAPRTALGVPAAGDLPLSPSDRGVSLSSRRRNCELFMSLAVCRCEARMRYGKSSAKRKGVPDSRAAPGGRDLSMRGPSPQSATTSPRHHFLMYHQAEAIVNRACTPSQRIAILEQLTCPSVWTIDGKTCLYSVQLPPNLDP